jgi:predicted porin
MKKSLIALAALASFAGLASAQSSVTLFGIVDASVSHYSVSGGTSKTVLANSGYNSSRLGFRGTEDLGGGMSASFWLEGALSNDDGTPAGLMFQRRSTVSLAGGWGELRLGRDYTPTFWNDTVFDPFGTNGVGTNIISQARTSSTATPFAFGVGANNATAVRSSNAIGYFLPGNLGGFYGQAQYALHEQTAGANGRYAGFRVGFAQGPFNVAAAYGKKTGASPATAAAPDVSTLNLGGQWDFGMAKLMGEFSREKYEVAGGSTTGKGFLIGTLVPVGAGEIRAAYSRVKLDAIGADPTAAKLALGYVHNLSKRTALYATYARIKNKDGAMLSLGGLTGIANASSTGYDLGVRHSF